MGELFPVILDGLVLLFLVTAIVFSARLSLQLKTFRDSRKELESLLVDLSQQVDKAELAIEGLRENARSSGREIQTQINEASSLRDELQLMTQAGDGLAGRLERVVDRHGQGREQEAPYQPSSSNGQRRKGRKTKRSTPEAGFAIRDPEFNETDHSSGYDEQGLLPGEDQDTPDDNSLHSQAERDLYDALKGKAREKSKAGNV